VGPAPTGNLPLWGTQTILDAADASVRATILQQILKLALMGRAPLSARDPLVALLLEPVTGYSIFSYP
jgi:hypothetical protein